jgi:hypothetical protein
MTRIEFKKTNHIFLDNGIIALHRYLEEYETKGECKRSLTEGSLVVESDDLVNVLEKAYYKMGREVYDTYTTKQENEPGNLYYIEAENRFETFPKIKTYGFTELLTNDISGTTTKEINTAKIEKLEEEKPELAAKIRDEFEKRGLKLLSKIYLNEPYTKLTRLEPLTKSHIEVGSEYCYLTGEKVKKLVKSQNTSPFISGLINFNSHIALEDKKMSWKALYLSRFSAANCLYAYANKSFKSLNVYFLGANSLTDLANLYENYLKEGVGIRLPREIWKVEMEFVRNFKLYNFGKEKVVDGFVGKNEYLFMVLYTLFERIVRHLEPQKELSEYADLLGEALESSDFNQLNPYIVSLRADAFAKTKRPNNFEVFTHLRYVMQLFRFFETEKIDILEILWSLKNIKPSLRSNRNSFELERRSRDRILGLILRGGSILNEIETIFYDCYRYLLDKGDKKVREVIGTKNFYQLVHLVKLYEPKINPLMAKEEKKERTWEESIIDLGYSFGMQIIGSGSEEGKIDKKSNARKGQKYIIGVRKSRTYNDFLEGFNHIVERFKPRFDYDVLAKVNESNYRTFKSYFILGLLSAVNQFLSSSNNSTTTV